MNLFEYRVFSDCYVLNVFVPQIHWLKLIPKAIILRGGGFVEAHE